LGRREEESWRVRRRKRTGGESGRRTGGVWRREALLV
jgi:hypothetical protein